MRIQASQFAYTDAARVKLGARGISTAEADQLLRNRNGSTPNPRGRGGDGGRILLVGQTDGGRWLTMVLEPTLDPTTWLVVTGWEAGPKERKIVG